MIILLLIDLSMLTNILSFSSVPSKKSQRLFFIGFLFLLAETARIEKLDLNFPGDEGNIGELQGPGTTVCYNLTLSDNIIRQVVWWDRGRLSLRLEPCIGKPHMKASVYGCPSDGARVVWEYMNAQMQGSGFQMNF
jgi:hypothetical protein